MDWPQRSIRSAGPIAGTIGRMWSPASWHEGGGTWHTCGYQGVPEVDFLATAPEGSAQLIQVAAEIGNRETFERKIRALQGA